MKILAIRGKNLASLEGEFAVDFTVEPLKSAGIFAITGCTGSGKSTLLDAICLALFDNTPRINRAENSADIPDVRNLTIKQKDSRNILRRGTAEAYAEVDFLSLSGEKYRARWSVRRARDKANGSLQGVTYRVTNLSSGEELQGGKTELLTKVKERIGLSFDQFTRAVLLAQGDFATFLKATKGEKAELLEKLTGTEIYSRISILIYEKAKQADNELSLIRERIKGIEILSEEQLQTLETEKEKTLRESETLDSEIKTATGKWQWLQTNHRLALDLEAAKNEWKLCRTAIEEAQPRFANMALTESAQTIRDTVKQVENFRKQLSADELSLQDQTKQNTQNREQLIQIDTFLKQCRTAKAELDAAWQKIEPKIKEARKLEVRIEESARVLSDTEKEISRITEQQVQWQKNIRTADAKTVSFQKSREEISRWFDANRPYTDIVPRIDLIVSLINDSFSSRKQAENNERLLGETLALLEKEEEQLNLQQAEAKRLNDILPAEIAALRAKLKGNEPCPVCGSTHHPIRGLHTESLEEETLNRTKAMVAREIDRLTENIGQRKNEIIRLQSLVERYKETYRTAFTKLTDAMKAIPDWETAYANGVLEQDLMGIARTWNENCSNLTAFTEQLAAQNQVVESLRQRLDELTQTLEEKQRKRTAIAAELAQWQQAKKECLGNRTADDVEHSYRKKANEADRQIEKATIAQNESVAASEKITGIISQLKESISRLQNEIETSEKAISVWLKNRTDGLTRDNLVLLLAQDSNRLTTERAALTALKNAELAAQAKLAERQSRADEHQQSELKPTETETIEILTSILEEKTVLFRQKQQRIAEIDILLSHHWKGKEKIARFEKEWAEKENVAENWKKLNELLGSADGAKFKVLAQGYTLDVLLGYANRHLKDLSQRYRLERVPDDSLSLQVVDLDMLSEVRSVYSLSGGESFLISLALALGLSSFSSNRMHVESLFIDEGFGSLDADTLRIAMDALERLQTQGRKIGVISHVAEMTERIPTQIRVIKTVNGKSRIEISNLGQA